MEKIDPNSQCFVHAYSRGDVPGVVFGVFSSPLYRYERPLTKSELAILESKNCQHTAGEVNRYL